MFSFLPLGQRVMDEIIHVVDDHFDKADAQKMQMPILQSTDRWEQTGRKEKMGKELFTLKDRKDQEYCLSPTNEEVITSLVKDLAIPACYPMILYQTSPKFRDEKRILSGVLRSKEFLMTDAYSFDKTPEEASQTFDKMNQCFLDIFHDLEIPIHSLEADNGVMGGSKSREFQCICGVGQDKVLQCPVCNYTTLSPPTSPTCSHLQSDSTVQPLPSLELGHMFLLGDRYSSPFNLVTPAGNVMMGCYGLGLSRILGSIFQLYGYRNGVVFPDTITTYDVVLVDAGRSEATRQCVIDLLDALGDVRFSKVCHVDERVTRTV